MDNITKGVLIVTVGVFLLFTASVIYTLTSTTHIYISEEDIRNGIQRHLSAAGIVLELAPQGMMLTLENGNQLSEIPATHICAAMGIVVAFTIESEVPTSYMLIEDAIISSDLELNAVAVFNVRSRERTVRNASMTDPEEIHYRMRQGSSYDVWSFVSWMYEKDIR